MDDPEVRWVRPAERTEGTSTPGIVREQTVATDGMWAGRFALRRAPEGNPSAEPGAAVVVRTGHGEPVTNAAHAWRSTSGPRQH